MMRSLCQPDFEGICTQCGRAVPPRRAKNCPAKSRENNPVAVRPKPEKRAELGDLTERMLKSLGVTQERVEACLKKVGLPPHCGCAERKEAMNQWSMKVRAWLSGEPSETS